MTNNTFNFYLVLYSPSIWILKIHLKQTYTKNKSKFILTDFLTQPHQTSYESSKIDNFFSKKFKKILHHIIFSKWSCYLFISYISTVISGKPEPGNNSCKIKVGVYKFYIISDSCCRSKQIESKEKTSKKKMFHQERRPSIGITYFIKLFRSSLLVDWYD